MSQSSPIVRADFTKPSASYRLRAWLAMLGLVLFVAIYVGLAGWFAYTTYRMLAGVFAGGDGAFASFLAAIPAGFLAIFMWKALFFLRRGNNNPGIEITEADQPRFFAFLNDLADEIGAPRPHRVFVSPGVNAAVFYDLSVLNFLLPSKKNLLVGLGLVNVLTRSELKAVLAHEFGHFAQKTMAVGRWVYIGEQIAAHIIGSRGALDRMLDGLSSIDIRIAWIGWIMRTVVWSIRSLMESVFRLVILAHRALSREMEFNADLVAVSVTGSDALVHGLYKTQPADEDWDESIQFCVKQLNKKKQVTDIFAVQTKIGEHMTRILGDFAHRTLPPIPGGNPGSHRIFTEQLAAPPRMWQTHPPNTERENNAKREYIAAQLDDSSAWDAFENVQQLRLDVTKFMFADVEFKEPPTDLTTQEALAELDKKYQNESTDEKYHGAYLWRGITTSVDTAEALLLPEQIPHEKIDAAFDKLYPDSLRQDVAALRSLKEEVALLEAVEHGIYEAPGGVVQHRGEAVRKSKIPTLVEEIKEDQQEVVRRLEQHDTLCRSAHHAAAQYVAHGWQDYLTSLIRLLHYAEHSEADARDAHGQLANTMSFAAATGTISGTDLTRVLRSARGLHEVLARLNSEAADVRAPQAVLKGLEADSWRAALENYDLPNPTRHNIADWMGVIDSWASSVTERFGRLRELVLDELLSVETTIREMYRGEQESAQAPMSLAVPSSYSTRTAGTERSRQKELGWWKRFTLADGKFPAALRLAVAAGIVGCVLYFGSLVGAANIIVYNGLNTTVAVYINGERTTVRPGANRAVSVTQRVGKIETKTVDGRLIEQFEESLDRGFATYVYNVAAAEPLIEFTAHYGTAAPVPPNPVGCVRWRTTSADHVFEMPPRSLETSSSGTTRLALADYTMVNEGPPLVVQQLVGIIEDDNERSRAILAHARWDDSDSQEFYIWIAMASVLPEFSEILASRLQDEPDNIMLLRLEQDAAPEDKKEGVLARHRELAAREPENPNWAYINVRTMPDSPEQDQAFVDGSKRWPTHVWFANAAAYVHARNTDWAGALASFKIVMESASGIRSTAALPAARIRRLLSGEDPMHLQEMKDSAEVAMLLALETGDAQFRNDPSYAYHLLNKGELKQAYETGRTTGKPNLRLTTMLAASEGAEQRWIDDALKLNPDEFEEQSQPLFLAALAKRTGRPHETWMARFVELVDQPSTDQGEVLKAAASKLFENGPNPGLLDQLTGLDPQERGVMLATAVILSPDDAQPAWRRDARRLLFAAERPFFRK